MAKVLQRLVRRGLLASHQGTRGGYELARRPTQISVADVIQAIDGPVTVTACSTEENQCEQFAKCNVRDPLWKVRERILSALGECTIAELAADVRPSRRRRDPRFFTRISAGLKLRDLQVRKEETNGRQASDLSGLPRHDARRSARRSRR